jgi:hypothetical protein
MNSVTAFSDVIKQELRTGGMGVLCDIAIDPSIITDNGDGASSYDDKLLA